MGRAIRHAYAHTPRGALHYAEAGEGPPLLLLHSTPRSHRQFRHLMMPLLAPRFRAIAVDAPGYGQSHALPAPTSIEWMAEALVLLLDALGVERAHLFGLHTGNKLAAAMAAHWPARIERLVFVGQTHSIIADGPERNRAIRAFSDRYVPRYGPSADGAHHVRAWAAAHAVAQSLWWPQSLQTGSPVDAGDVAAAEARVIDHLLGWRSVVPTYEAILAFDLADALRRVEAPTLVLELLTEQEAHLGAQAGRICAMMRRATPAAIQGADGGVVEARPGLVMDAILPFLAV